jgi:hypothetical protein
MDRLFRADGYTTDSFMLIKTELEKAELRKKKTTEGACPNIKAWLDRTILNTDKNDIVELVFTNEENSERTMRIDLLRFVSTDTTDTRPVFIQKRYANRFPKKGIAFYQQRSIYTRDNLNPVIVKQHGLFIGCIMPIRVEN